jgi:hypothetical protein
VGSQDRTDDDHYLDQIAVSSLPETVEAADHALRIFAEHLAESLSYESVDWVRALHCKKAVETAEQESFARHFSPR